MSNSEYGSSELYYFADVYSGLAVKIKILDFYLELIWLISYKERGENNSIQPMFGNQVQNGIAQGCKYEYIFR